MDQKERDGDLSLQGRRNFPHRSTIQAILWQTFRDYEFGKEFEVFGLAFPSPFFVSRKE
jgi:hypothetical protein